MAVYEVYYMAIRNDELVRLAAFDTDVSAGYIELAAADLKQDELLRAVRRDIEAPEVVRFGSEFMRNWWHFYQRDLDRIKANEDRERLLAQKTQKHERDIALRLRALSDSVIGRLLAQVRSDAARYDCDALALNGDDLYLTRSQNVPEGHQVAALTDEAACSELYRQAAAAGWDWIGI